MKIALVYVSRAKIEYSSDQLNTMVNEFRTKNNKLGIKGFLCLHKKMFLQYMEGEKEDVVRLFNKISIDKRHKVVNYLVKDLHLDDKFHGWNTTFLTKENKSDYKLENYIIERLNLMANLDSRQEWEDTIWLFIDEIARINTAVATQKM